MVYAHLLCTNRRLAEQVPVGARLVAEGPPQPTRGRCLYEPTPQRDPPMDSETLWRLVSLLTLNHQSLVDGSTGCTQLREMLTNLVDNAIRYTPEGGRITVRCGWQAGAPFAEVEDSGAGIDPDERRRVFERFYRSPKAVAEGSGLGLSIVREIAQSHEAQVQVLDAEGGPGVVVRVLVRSASGVPAAGT